MLIKRNKIKITCYLSLGIIAKKILTAYEKFTSKTTPKIVKNVSKVNSQNGEERDCLHIHDIDIHNEHLEVSYVSRIKEMKQKIAANVEKKMQ